jgi:hypothetical protein
MADNEKKSSRRAFFGKMVLLGTGAAAGATVVLTGLQYEKKKDAKGKVQLLTADNRLLFSALFCNTLYNPCKY